MTPRDARGRTFRQRYPRHPAQVTSDRLGDHLMRWHDRIEPADRDKISEVRYLLEAIAEQDGAGP
jgi:hypothetical protein